MPPGHVKRGYDFRGQLLKELTRRYKERFLLGTTLYEAERSLRASVPSGLVGVLLGLAKSIYRTLPPTSKKAHARVLALGASPLSTPKN
jgi:hypothetical protein